MTCARFSSRWAAAQRVHVGIELALGDQHAAKALDRHVGQGEQFVEDDAVSFAEVLFVGGLQRGLGWRQARALRVVDQVQEQPAAVGTIAQRVELPQAAQAGLEHALAALLVDVFLEVAGQRGDDLHAMGGKEGGHVLGRAPRGWSGCSGRSRAGRARAPR
jgi:hypothetical protein